MLNDVYKGPNPHWARVGANPRNVCWMMTSHFFVWIISRYSNKQLNWLCLSILYSLLYCYLLNVALVYNRTARIVS